MSEIVSEFFFSVNSKTECPHLKYFSIGKCLGIGFNIFHKRVDKVYRLSASGADKNFITPFNIPENRILGNKFFRVLVFPFLYIINHCGQKKINYSNPEEITSFTLSIRIVLLSLLYPLVSISLCIINFAF